MRSPDSDEDFKHALDGLWVNTTVRAKMNEQLADEIFKNITGAKVIAMRHGRSRSKWLIAACVILLLGIGTYVIFTNGEKRQSVQPIAQTHDVSPPKETRAVITLADGSKVYLDSAAIGILAQQNNVNVVKNDSNDIVYQGVPSISNRLPVTYNTLYNPRGSKVVTLALSDGTRVWLNSESSLRYPTAFSGDSRDVEITGEAYFEVAHNAARPFRVKKGGATVIVLGTHFNVNAYDDEGILRVTLLEGSVQVSANHNSVNVKPNEQAVVRSGSPLTIDHSPDIEQVMAWKNGFFRFNNTSIESIMKQVERWYDVEVVYQVPTGNLNFSGYIGRKENVSRLLKIMELTGVVHFKIEGKTITVLK